MLETEDLKPLVDQQALSDFRNRALTPERPVARGMAENPRNFLCSPRKLQPLLRGCA